MTTHMTKQIIRPRIGTREDWLAAGALGFAARLRLAAAPTYAFMAVFTGISAEKDSLDILLVGRRVGMMHIVCYLRQGSNVFETYWTTRRGVEAMDNSYRLLDLTVYGRQERW